MDSKVVDISDLPDEDGSINICIMSQALMGSNHMKYIDEAVRVLGFGCELWLAESKGKDIDNNDKYEKISKYVEDLDMIIMNADDYDETKQYFMIKCRKI
jgi:hypothetical protein